MISLLLVILSKLTRWFLFNFKRAFTFSGHTIRTFYPLLFICRYLPLKLFHHVDVLSKIKIFQWL